MGRTILATIGSLLLSLSAYAQAQPDGPAEPEEPGEPEEAPSEPPDDMSAEATPSWLPSGSDDDASSTSVAAEVLRTGVDPTGVFDDAEVATDHERVVGTIGVGFLGIDEVPLRLSDATGETSRLAIHAPVLGVRCWFGSRIGLDVGLGFGFTNTRIKIPSEGRDQDQLKAFAVALHAGAPISLHEGSHYTFLVVPEMTFAVSDGEVLGDTSVDDVVHRGYLFRGGARIGAEIHFGFIDVPELSLQTTVGIHYQYEKTRQNQQSDPTSLTRSAAHFGTTLEKSPFEILSSSLMLVYYFR